jgi:hypothetical protein
LVACAGFDLHQRQKVGCARTAPAVALFTDCGVGAEPFDDRAQGGDFPAAFVDPHILVGQFTAGALPVLVAVHVDQREGFAALIDQFVEVTVARKT